MMVRWNPRWPSENRPVTRRTLWRKARSDDPVIDEIDGTERSRCVRELPSLDRKRIEISRAEVLRPIHHAKADRQRWGNGGHQGRNRKEAPSFADPKVIGARGDGGPEDQARVPDEPAVGRAYLPPGRTEFDLLVIDEASQVPPEDALGAVARARHVVVVGDDKQLPPTNFFDMLINDDDESQDDDAPAGSTRDFESILTLARARGMPERMLRWHYRSRHPSLIALSNHACYGGSLLLPPSPHLSNDGLGLTLVRTPPGQYDRGGTGRNQAEARIIAEYVERHLREHPDLSLGVACFSVAQRDAIEDALYAAGLTSAAKRSARMASACS